LDVGLEADIGDASLGLFDEKDVAGLGDGRVDHHADAGAGATDAGLALESNVAHVVRGAGATR
jgi:hypothetical protein